MPTFRPAIHSRRATHLTQAPSTTSTRRRFTNQPGAQNAPADEL